MKKIIFFSAIVMMATVANAQTITIPVGKKIQTIVSDQKTITFSQMGQDMEMPSTSELYSNFTVKSVDGKKVQLTATVTRIKVAISMMGQDIKIDSDDSTTLSNPQFAEAVKDVNKPKDVTIELGKSQEKSDLESAGNQENLALVLFLPFEKNAKVGSTITDSTGKADSSNYVNVYTLTQSGKDEITVTETNNSKILGTKKQSGMEVKQNMQISSTATRVYDVATGLLKSETKTMNATGTNEMQGMSIPVSMKGNSTTTIK